MRDSEVSMMATTFKRWAVAAAVAAVALLAGTAQAQNNVLRVVPHSNLAVLDPIWTTAYMSRNHGYMIYDTLFALDEKLAVKPQMVDRYETSADKLT
ncbi:MAG TPA: ABC transporter substrate-binding protein, partial [Burkholderiaceae bacterium]